MTHPIDAHVGRRLRSRREQKGLSQQQLAQRIGLAFQQLHKYENGSNRISASMLWQIACALEVTPNDFFEGLDQGNGKSLNRTPIGDEDDTRTRRQILSLNRRFAAVSSPDVRSRLLSLVRAIAGAGY